MTAYMADQAQGTQTNGTATRAAVLPAPSNAERAQSRIRASRASTLAALESGTDVEAEVAPPAANAAQTPVEEVEAPAPTTDDVELETPTEAPVVEAKPEAADPESSKRLATIQAAEKRSREKIAKEREQLAADRAAIEKEHAAIVAEKAEFERWKKARERAAIDPVSYLEEVPGVDLEYAAKMAYAKAKASTDPAQREAAARELRAREHETELQATRRRLEELEQKLTAKEQQAQFESHRSAYLDHAVKAIGTTAEQAVAELGEDAPLARAMAAKNPAKLRQRLWATAERLIEANDGDVPDIGEVVIAFEKARRAELEELGIDPTTVLSAPKAAPQTKQNSQPADKKHTAKTLGNDLSTPRVPRPTKSDKEHRAETLAMLERGSLE